MNYADDALFCRLYPHVLRVEGGFVDDPKDPGGPTNFGIAWNYNADALKRVGVARDTMRALTKEQALQIYYDKYWLAADTERITDAGLALIHFDCAVNCGVGTAKSIKSKLSVNPDNFDGSGNANEALFLRLVLEYELLRLDYYNHLRSDLRARYMQGWVNRLSTISRLAGQLE